MYKSKLQEYCQSKSWKLPEYSTTKEGFDHCPKFKASVIVNGSTFTTPDFYKSSKDAQNFVAQLAFDLVTGIPAPVVSVTSSTPQQPELSERVQATPMSVATDDKKVKDMAHLYKNQLQIYTQKKNLNLPVYISEREGPPHASRFKCKVTLEGKTYECQEFHNTLKDAENAAAKIALMSVSSIGIEQEDASVCKNLLQELAQKEYSCLPEYNTTSSGPSHAPVFISTVEIKGESFIGEAAKTKKLAEMYAAKVAYSTLKTREHQKVLESKHVVLHPETNLNIGQNSSGQKLEDMPFSRSPSHSPARPSQPPSTPSIIHINKTPARPSQPPSTPSISHINKPSGIPHTSSAHTVRVIPREENMTLPPGAKIEYEDDKWIAVAMPTDSVQGNV